MTISDIAAVTRYVRAAFVACLEGAETSEPFLSWGKVRRNLVLFATVRKVAKVFGNLDYIGLASPWLRDVELLSKYLASVRVYELEREYVPIMVANARLAFGWNEFSYICGDILTDINSGAALVSQSDSARPWILNLDFCAEVDLSIAPRLAECIAVRYENQDAPQGVFAVTFRSRGSKSPQPLLDAISFHLTALEIKHVAGRAIRYRGDFRERMSHISLVIGD